MCCGAEHGPKGNKACLSAAFTYESCCAYNPSSEAAASVSTCWTGGIERENCCHPKFGPGGNPSCWDGQRFTNEVCCGTAIRSAA